ncbi:hypothetical protein ABPG75_004661 [Micractinium tetrahymenae]
MEGAAPAASPARQRAARAELLWAVARELASGDASIERWELEPPAHIAQRRRGALQLQHREDHPFSVDELQWLLDTPCQEVLKQVHVKEVGGATKAAQAAAAAAQQQRPAGPHRVVTWQHVLSGASLAVEVPLSVFSKQEGAVFVKWQQRAWRALYALRCQVGEEVWPDGCREAAAAGAPCWDDLEEERAALAKFPFCMPQKCKAQLLGLGTTKRLKNELLSKRKGAAGGAAGAKMAAMEGTGKQSAKWAAKRRRQQQQQQQQPAEQQEQRPLLTQPQPQLPPPQQQQEAPPPQQQQEAQPPQQQTSAPQWQQKPLAPLLATPAQVPPLQLCWQLSMPQEQQRCDRVPSETGGQQQARRAQGSQLARPASWRSLAAPGAPAMPLEQPGSMAAVLSGCGILLSDGGIAACSSRAPIPAAAAPEQRPRLSAAPAVSGNPKTPNSSCTSSGVPCTAGAPKPAGHASTSRLPERALRSAHHQSSPAMSSLNRQLPSPARQLMRASCGGSAPGCHLAQQQPLQTGEQPVAGGAAAGTWPGPQQLLRSYRNQCDASSWDPLLAGLLEPRDHGASAAGSGRALEQPPQTGGASLTAFGGSRQGCGLPGAQQPLTGHGGRRHLWSSPLHRQASLGMLLAGRHVGSAVQSGTDGADERRQGAAQGCCPACGRGPELERLLLAAVSSLGDRVAGFTRLLVEVGPGPTASTAGMAGGAGASWVDHDRPQRRTSGQGGSAAGARPPGGEGTCEAAPQRPEEPGCKLPAQHDDLMSNEEFAEVLERLFAW